MYARQQALQDFIDIAQDLFQSPTLPEAAREHSRKVFARLEQASDDGKRDAPHYPARAHLDPALAPVATRDDLLGAAARSIRQLEPSIGWQRRTSGLYGSENYIENHVNGMIVGPGGMESRYDVLLGFSLLAPSTRYPDHQHPPEEAYVLFTRGEFRQEDGDWFDPGVGGGLYNRSNLVHAMRSHDVPMLALWCLLV